MTKVPLKLFVVQIVQLVTLAITVTMVTTPTMPTMAIMVFALERQHRALVLADVREETVRDRPGQAIVLTRGTVVWEQLPNVASATTRAASRPSAAPTKCSQLSPLPRQLSPQPLPTQESLYLSEPMAVRL